MADQIIFLVTDENTDVHEDQATCPEIHDRVRTGTQNSDLPILVPEFCTLYDILLLLLQATGHRLTEFADDTKLKQGW